MNNNSTLRRVFLVLTFFFISHSHCVASTDTRSVPAQCTSELSLAGKNNKFKRPGRIFYQDSHEELFVADAGNNRIIIYDDNNIVLYEIYLKEYLSSPVDIAVDSNGYIYVLGNSSKGTKILKLDFDGVPVSEIKLEKYFKNPFSQIHHIFIDKNNHLYLLEEINHQILVLDEQGSLIRKFNISTKLKDHQKSELVYGAFFIKDSAIFIPISNLGTINIYSLIGEHIRNFGIKGATPGRLSFPVSVAVSRNDIVMVLDKNRFNIVCFNVFGSFLGEFGGKGMNIGWFYYPSSIAVDKNDNICVGQVYKNRIQICKLPEFIAENHESILIKSSN